MAGEISVDELRLTPPPKDFYHFLIVDDEEVARKLMRSILETAGYRQIDDVGSGEVAINALNHNPYHVVLLDKNMPGKDGLEVLMDGKVIQPECEFIMITAYGSMETAILAMDLGAYSYVTKPFSDVKILLRRVEGALDRVTMRIENSVLLNRLSMLLSELEQAQADLDRLRQAQEFPNEQEFLQRALGATQRLRRLATQLERLKERAKGTAADLIRKVGQEVSGVADMLSGESSEKPQGVLDR